MAADERMPSEVDGGAGTEKRANETRDRVGAEPSDGDQGPVVSIYEQPGAKLMYQHTEPQVASPTVRAEAVDLSTKAQDLSMRPQNHSAAPHTQSVSFGGPASHQPSVSFVKTREEELLSQIG